MTESYSTIEVSRRRFMVGVAGMTFAIAVGEASSANAATEAPIMAGTAFNPWVSIASNGDISIISPATEMGQGSMTSLPLILAEELDADWSKVIIVPAPPIDKIYGNPGFGGVMHTASSATVTGFFTVLRTFGAQVRSVLLDNVAKHWNVPTSRAEHGAERRRPCKIGPAHRLR
jgi:isoquinoline 1-oxidoreductase subunit beta